MKVLFIGNSVTKGKLGANFVNIISQKNKNLVATNLGVDGETLNVIFSRIHDHLKNNSNYDYIVIEGGYNDILLPSFLEKGLLFKLSYKIQLNKGLLPFLNIAEMTLFLDDCFRYIKQIYNGKILVTNIACVGENLKSKLNFRRNEINEVYKNLASKHSLILVDTQKEFDKYLAEKPQSNYSLLFDKTKNDTIELGRKRGLFLTIDGVHLNQKGAEIYADCVLQKLL